MEKWKTTNYPTLEITTSIPVKGCVVDCIYCPQRLLVKSYQGERILDFENFKKVIDKLPKEIRISFAGFTEPWLNRNCIDMLLYAHEKQHSISVFTTGIGMNLDDVDKIKNIPYSLGPNGGFALHIPDNENFGKHPINSKYIEVLEKIKFVSNEIQGFYVVSMGSIHEKICHIFNSAVIPEMWSRAGNLVKETLLKPELLNVKDNYKSIYHQSELTCKCEEKLYHNILLPNGDVSLCCMDYGMEHILGNLFSQEYDDIIPEPFSCFNLCKFCENGVGPIKEIIPETIPEPIKEMITVKIV